MKNIYLIVGQSGSGKDTVVNIACERYGYKRLRSYTTREQRSDPDDIKSHIFATVDDYYFDKEHNQVAADSTYDGNIYWALKDQLDINDIYIVDIKGVEALRENYHKKNIVVVGITADEDVRRRRMQKRGDSAKDIDRRIKKDINEFFNLRISADTIIKNNEAITAGQAADLLHQIIEEYELKRGGDNYLR